VTGVDNVFFTQVGPGGASTVHQCTATLSHAP
jgi:hypothetical protein